MAGRHPPPARHHTSERNIKRRAGPSTGAPLSFFWPSWPPARPEVDWGGGGRGEGPGKTYPVPAPTLIATSSEALASAAMLRFADSRAMSVLVVKLSFFRMCET